MASNLEILSIGKVLCDENIRLKERFRALFTLKNIGGRLCIEIISSCFSDPSALLKHELAYCLGQMGDINAIPKLSEILANESEDPIVRHEAGEALGAIGDSSSIQILEEFKIDPINEVAQTCQLALQRIQCLSNKPSTSGLNNIEFTSIDPAPPSEEKNVEVLQRQLIDEELPLFERYRAMFSLRNINTHDSAKALATGFKSSGALFKHEIGFVLGQMACENEYVVEHLGKVVADKNEHEMVRHEAAEALGSIASEEANVVLKRHLNDDTRVVRESCEVALDILDYERSKDFQYADELQKIRSNKISND